LAGKTTAIAGFPGEFGNLRNFLPVCDCRLAPWRPIWQSRIMKRTLGFPFIGLFALLLSAGLAGAVNTETPMTAAEFETYVTGKTLFYGVGGVEYGAEEYLPGRRVVWSLLDGDCQKGVWYERGNMICFAYEGRNDPQCWTFYKQGNGVMARFENDPAQTELYETRQTTEPLICLGPEVGV